MPWQPDYVTSTEGKEFMRGPSDTVDDAFTAAYITSASRAVDGYCRRQFGRVDAAEHRPYRAVYDRHLCHWLVDIDDLMDLTGFVVTVNDVTTTNYRLEPVNADKKGKPWTQLVFTGAPFPCGRDFEVDGLGVWGWTEIPIPVKNATLVQMHRFAIDRVSPYGLAGMPQEGVITPKLQARLHPDAIVMLGSGYVRW
jgi:hypothetical protein